MINLNELLIFATVVETGNFTEAAKILGSQKSSVSRKVTLLEKRLNVQLLHRSTRSITLTEAGEIYYSYCSRVVEEARAAEYAIGQYQSVPTGTLSIIAPKAFARRFLADPLFEYARKNPQLHLQLKLDDQPQRLERSQADVALTPFRTETGKHEHIALGQATRILVAAPGYLEQYKPPAKPEDLQEGHNFIVTSAWSDAYPWQLKNGANEQEVEIQPGSLELNDLDMAIELAKTGCGIALVPLVLVEDDIRQGELVEILPDWTAKPVPLFLAFHSDKYQLPKISGFINFIRDTFAQAPPWDFENQQHPVTGN